MTTVVEVTVGGQTFSITVRRSVVLEVAEVVITRGDSGIVVALGDSSNGKTIAGIYPVNAAIADSNDPSNPGVYVHLIG